MSKTIDPEVACSHCGVQHEALYLHSRCHPTSKTWAVMHPDQTLVIECGECGKFIVRFKILEMKG